MLNLGNAMNISSGIFTTPKSGIYSFSVSGLNSYGKGSLRVYMLLNGIQITNGYVGDGTTSHMMSIHSTLRLKKDDQISLRLSSGVLHDHPSYFYTNFVGWLVEEDLTGQVNLI